MPISIFLIRQKLRRSCLLKRLSRGGQPVYRKTQLTLRVDRDVVDWFKGQGRGYQTRINALLRAYKEAHGKAV